MKAKIVLAALVLMAFPALAAIPVMDSVDAPSCEDLKGEIKNLRQAQSYLMKSFVQKNDTLAETLEIFAKDVLGQKAKNAKSDSKKLKQAASSFRSHSLREQGLVDRFEALAQDLYSRIEECLPKNETASSPAAAPQAQTNQ